MPFLSLSLYHFRNLQDDKIDLSSKEVYFVGENGQGKTNILEALYYSAYGSSFKTHIDGQIIKYGKKNFAVNSLYNNEKSNTQQIHIAFENNKKIIEKNGKRIRDRKDLINTIPCVLFSHDDMQFTTGAPEVRRFFLDQSLTMYDAFYIDDLRNYRKILKTRNLILKESDYQMLDIYDAQLAKYGLEIQKKRKKTVFQFNQIFGKLYEEISGINGLSIEYEPSWKEIKEDVGYRFPTEEEVTAHLFEKRDSNKIMMRTLSGPHLDKIIFKKDGANFIHIASTGQCRLISLLLRILQAVWYNRITGIKPVLLMDDVLLELDPVKRAKLTSLLPEYDQLFCTFLTGEPYENYRHSTTKVYTIQGGNWYEQK